MGFSSSGSLAGKHSKADMGFTLKTRTFSCGGSQLPICYFGDIGGKKEEQSHTQKKRKSVNILLFHSVLRSYTESVSQIREFYFVISLVGPLNNEAFASRKGSPPSDLFPGAYGGISDAEMTRGRQKQK